MQPCFSRTFIQEENRRDVRFRRHAPRLGELLHHRLFVANKHWYVRRALPFGGPQSLGNFRELLSEGIAGLEYATSGTLLANPKFTEMVSDVMQGPSGND